MVVFGTVKAGHRGILIVVEVNPVGFPKQTQMQFVSLGKPTEPAFANSEVSHSLPNCRQEYGKRNFNTPDRENQQCPTQLTQGFSGCLYRRYPSLAFTIPAVARSF